MLSAWCAGTHNKKRFAATHVEGKGRSCRSCLLPWLYVCSCVHAHTVTPWDTYSHPWKSSAHSVSHPPGSPQVTLHFLLAWPPARSSLEARSCPGCTDWVWKRFQDFFKWCSSCLAYLASSLKIICPSAGI